MTKFMNKSYFELDLFNESVDSGHKTGLKDLFTNQTDPVLDFSSLIKDSHSS